MLEALGLNLTEIIFTIINFAIFVGVLTKFLYKPFLGALEARKEAIQNSFDRADAVNKEAEEKLENYEKRIANFEQEGREIIANAKEAADRNAEKILEDARKEAAEIMAKAERDIKAERDKATAEMKQEIAALAIMAAEQIVEKEIESAGQATIVDDVINKARSTGWQN